MSDYNNMIEGVISVFLEKLTETEEGLRYIVDNSICKTKYKLNRLCGLTYDGEFIDGHYLENIDSKSCMGSRIIMITDSKIDQVNTLLKEPKILHT